MVNGGWLLMALGLGVLALPAIFGESNSNPDASALSQSVEMPIAESKAKQKCETALILASQSMAGLQFIPATTQSRSPGSSNRLVKIVFSEKNSRNIQLDFSGWCEVSPDGKAEIVSLIETAGRDFLASSQPTSVRDDYVQRVKIAGPRSGTQNSTGVITNRNDFPIRSIEVTCRIQYSGAYADDDVTLKIGRVIPAGGSTKIQMPRAVSPQTVTCQTTDFLRVASAEQRLIEIFGSIDDRSSFARLRQDAIRIGVSVDTLVEPFITLAKALASSRRAI
jgi:hypothetical protein